MIYCYYYKTPEAFSDLWMKSDGNALTGVYFAGFGANGCRLPQEKEKLLPVFEETAEWLDRYFAGEIPVGMPNCSLEGLSVFRREVIGYLCQIPYGETVSYGEIAASIAQRRGIARMSAQAVGGAVGHNPISILIPCHRVIGADGSMTGYGGGMGNKIALLKHERMVMDRR